MTTDEIAAVAQTLGMDADQRATLAAGAAAGVPQAAQLKELAGFVSYVRREHPEARENRGWRASLVRKALEDARAELARRADR